VFISFLVNVISEHHSFWLQQTIDKLVDKYILLLLYIRKMMENSRKQ